MSGDDTRAHVHYPQHCLLYFPSYFNSKSLLARIVLCTSQDLAINGHERPKISNCRLTHARSEDQFSPDWHHHTPESTQHAVCTACDWWCSPIHLWRHSLSTLGTRKTVLRASTEHFTVCNTVSIFSFVPSKSWPLLSSILPTRLDCKLLGVSHQHGVQYPFTSQQAQTRSTHELTILCRIPWTSGHLGNQTIRKNFE